MIPSRPTHQEWVFFKRLRDEQYTLQHLESPSVKQRLRMTDLWVELSKNFSNVWYQWNRKNVFQYFEVEEVNGTKNPS